jgi:hypothetical protein
MEQRFKTFTSNLNSIFQHNFKNIRAVELVKNNYQIFLDQYDFDLRSFVRNLNETLMSWIVDTDIDIEEFDSLLVYTFNKKPKIVDNIRSLVTKDNIRFIDLIQIISQSNNLEQNAVFKKKIDILMAYLISIPEPPDTFLSLDL